MYKTVQNTMSWNLNMDVRFNRDLQAEQNASERLLDCSQIVFVGIHNRIQARIIIFDINFISLYLAIRIGNFICLFLFSLTLYPAYIKRRGNLLYWLLCTTYFERPCLSCS